MLFVYVQSYRNYCSENDSALVIRNPELILRRSDLFKRSDFDLNTQGEGEGALSRIAVYITHLDLLYLYNDPFLSYIIDSSRLCRGVLRVHIHGLDLCLRFLSLEIYT